MRCDNNNNQFLQNNDDADVDDGFFSNGEEMEHYTLEYDQKQ